jgi:hypothetical protein
VDVADKLLGCLYIAADIINDLLEDLFDHRNLIIDMVRNFQVSPPRCKILLSLIALVESARIERICAMIFASNSVNSGVSGIAV